ncbi:28 kDa heat- and acid-stable phosphoprotein-like [Toxorhynchites rutilus septentrionalis]|uniref:28 kDa heat- and acid-stable phosphoprotein-like n=1 Tax=Toxorhynchites rutilus septentrionalis TaxID=329112 RepID=UPI00247861A8|nr:28 kDa heat- and acid-stable phosphoprotein-like [Toxorhynchites rutilus septentrionalis]
MPRGKYVNHKGRNRHFTNPEELEAERKNEEQKKKWRDTHGESSEEEEEDEEAGSPKGSDDSEDSEEEDEKGAKSVIEVQNPNRVSTKAFMKAADVDENQTAQLSRKEREQVEKQKAHAAYAKRHAEGKTAQAKADLARLAIIKQHRAEAAARREAEKKAKETKK